MMATLLDCCLLPQNYVSTVTSFPRYPLAYCPHHWDSNEEVSTGLETHLGGDIDHTTHLGGDIDHTTHLGGDIDHTTHLGGDIDHTTLLAGDIEHTTHLGGDIEHTTHLAGDINHTTHLGGDIEHTTHLAGDIEHTTHLAGDINHTTHLGGDIEHTTHLAGDIEHTAHLAGDINHTTHLGGDIDHTTHLAGDIEHTTHLGGDIDHTTHLGGDIVTECYPHLMNISVVLEPCLPDQFTCDNGHCIPNRWKCDTTPDCDDGSDEPLECGSSDAISVDVPVPTTCKPGQFKCQFSNKCIPHGWLCDGESDCGMTSKHEPDNSDEDQHKCKNCFLLLRDSGWFPSKYVLYLSCLGLGTNPLSQSCHISVIHAWFLYGVAGMNSVVCTPNYYRCDKSVICLPITTLCDSMPDCPDNSDEQEFCEDGCWSTVTLDCQCTLSSTSPSMTSCRGWLLVSKLAMNVLAIINSTATLSVCLLVSGNTSICSSIKCEFGCKPSSSGPLCYCDKGWQPNGTRCVDFDDCLIDGSCDQHCTNTVGSYSCSCFRGLQSVRTLVLRC
uniref:(California timema) hypothetical protein n=1 Tax=Timema californicum TaxID=61474 RepID=A0A7R9JI03_TIMCA|nr:unnamed protein product [Timema californicum]